MEDKHLEQILHLCSFWCGVWNTAAVLQQLGVLLLSSEVWFPLSNASDVLFTCCVSLIAYFFLNHYFKRTEVLVQDIKAMVRCVSLGFTRLG